MSWINRDVLGQMALGIVIPYQGQLWASKVVLGAERVWLSNSGAHRLYQGTPWMSVVVVGTTLIFDGNLR